MNEGMPEGQWAPWKRKAFGAGLLACGLLMALYGLWEFVSLLIALGGDRQVVVVSMDMAGFVPLGIAIATFGLVPFFSPPAPKSGRGRGRPPVDIAAVAVIACLASLVLFPVLVFALRATTNAVLTRRGYVQHVVDQGFHSHYLIVRWQKPEVGGRE
jgi:hypothetical protein